METKEYFEKVMQDYNQHRNSRSLRKYCKDEAVDYEWLLGFKKNYPSPECQQSVSSQNVIAMINFTNRTTYYISSVPMDMHAQG